MELFQDYDPFGSLLPGRNYSSGSYRYGLNGQEKDDEIYGATGTSYTAEFWQYDPRTAQRWNIDPVVKPFESGYSAFGRSPVLMVDPNGADWFKNNESGQTTWHEATGKQGEEVSLKDMEGTWTNLGTEFAEFSGDKLTYSWQVTDDAGKPSVQSMTFHAVSGRPEASESGKRYPLRICFPAGLLQVRLLSGPTERARHRGASRRTVYLQ